MHTSTNPSIVFCSRESAPTATVATTTEGAQQQPARPSAPSAAATAAVLVPAESVSDVQREPQPQ